MDSAQEDPPAAPALSPVNQAHWGGASTSQAPQGLETSYMEFFSDDACPSLFMDLLDPQTLAALHTHNPDMLPPPAPPSEEMRKKLSEQDSDVEEEDTGAAGGSKAGNKRARSEANQAAKNKANREKARREKINDRFNELAQLLDPGKDPKTDKSSILQDAIKCVQQMRMENHQLRQLNKFLEERMGQLERERGQNLYQQSLLMQQHGGGGMMGLPGMPGPCSIPPFQPSLPSASTPIQLAAAAAAMAAAADPHGGASTSSAPFLLPPMCMPSAPSGQSPADGHSNQPGGSERRPGTPAGSRPSSSARVSPKPPHDVSSRSSHAQSQAGDVGALDTSETHYQLPALPPHPVQGGESEVGEGTLDGLSSMQLPAASIPQPAAKLGQQAAGLPMGAGTAWFPASSGTGGAGVHVSFGEQLFGGNWVRPEMLDSMQDSLLRPPAA